MEIPLRCDSCGFKAHATLTIHAGDRCANPYINNGCDGQFKVDQTPEAPGYIARVVAARLKDR